MSLDNANQITLTSVRGYNTMLCRPRRQRIVVAPGSVICESIISGNTKNAYSDALLRWKGFGEDFEKVEKPRVSEKITEPPIFNNSEICAFHSLIKQLLDEKFSRAQAGIFREFLNSKRNDDEIERVIKHRIDKYKKKKYSAHEKLYNTMLGLLGNRNKLTVFVSYMLDELYLKWWEEKNQ